MKTIQLTPNEFYIFKQIAKFKYVIELIKHQSVFVTADINKLAMLGY
jgi:hypothetical protein